MARLRGKKISSKAGIARAKYEESKHRRDAGGKYADKPGAGDDAPRRVGGRSSALDEVGLTRESRVKIGPNTRTVDEWMTGGAKLKAKEIAEGVRRGMYKVEGGVSLSAPTYAPKLVDVPTTTTVGPIRQQPLSDTDRAAFKEYQYGDYANLNARLRAGDASDPIVRDLDAAISKGELVRDVMVHRGLAFWDSGSAPKWRPGQTITDRGYVSTSTDPDVAMNFAADTGAPVTATLRLRARAGTRAAFFQDYDGYTHNEVVLPRGTQYRVTRVDQDDDGNDVVWADVL